MPQARLVLVVAGNDLRRRLRDRSALVTAFVAPLALAAVISAALGSAAAFEAEIGVVDADAGATSRDMAGQLLGGGRSGGAGRGGGISFVAVASEAGAAEQVGDDELGAAIVFPAGFGAGVAAGRPVAVRVVRDAERAITGEVAAAVAESLAARLNAANLSLATVAATDPRPPEALGALAGRAAAAGLPVRLREVTPGGGRIELAAYFGPSMAIVFLFLTVGFGARSVAAERREGTLARLLSAPITMGTIVAAKTASVLVLGLASIVALWAATSLVFGASWGDPGPVLALCVATVVAISGISALVTALARTEAQAEGLTSIVTFTLAILGGNFVSPGALPGLLRRLSLLTPNGQALRAFTEVSSGGGLGDIGLALVLLLVVGAVTGGLAVTLFTRVAR